MNTLPFRALIPMLNAPLPQQMPEALRDLMPPEGFGIIPPPPMVVSEGFARRLREFVEASEPPVVVDTTAEEAAQALDVLSRQMDELPTLHAPPRGRIVKQANGPNRAADRARGIYGKRGKK